MAEDLEAVVESLATKIADKIWGDLQTRIEEIREIPELFAHVAEHEATGHGRVINAERARSTPCKYFEYKGETFAWSPGVLGLMSSAKNPEQIKEFCAVGMIRAGEGVKRRFQQIKGVVGSAHSELEKKGGGLPEWWEKVGAEMERTGVELSSSTSKSKPTRDDVRVEVWEERDRLHIGIQDKETGEYYASWWDDEARDMYEQGFFKSGRGLEESVLSYAEDVGVLSK